MTLRRLASLLVGAGLVLAPPAYADEAEDIGRLLKQGQHKDALERADKFLASNPKDAQVRFLKGLILTEQNRANEAIKVFTALAEDYPELPEPYNNLAVLYAQQNQLDKAKSALQLAIQTNPAYATAHENLGDLYARLASQAYDRALSLEKGNSGAQAKLTLIRELFNKNPRGSKLPQLATASSTAKPQMSPVTPPAVTPAPAKPVPTPTPAQTIAKIDPPKPVEPKPVADTKPAVDPGKAKPADAKPVEAKPVETKPAEPAKVADSKNDKKATEAEVLKSLNDWADAWSDRKVSAYLGFYAKNFKPPKGESRGEWEKQRRERISAAKSISVKLSNFKVDFDDDDTATVRMVQAYRSDALKSSTGKTIVLIKTGGRWLIKEERVG